MSFNVTCGFSNITIEEGDKVIFIPLIPNNQNKYNYGVSSTNLLKPTENFRPLSFPIKGFYNGYGTIKDIVKDNHTDLLESYLGCTIEELIKIIQCQKNFNDKNSELFYHFAKNKNLPSNLSLLVKEFGFTNNRNTFYKNEHLESVKDYTIQVIDEDGDLNVAKFMIGDVILDRITGPSFIIGERFFNKFYELFGYELNVSEENRTIVELLKGSTGMFVLEEVYNEFVLKQKISKKELSQQLETIYDSATNLMKVIKMLEGIELYNMIPSKIQEANIFYPFNDYGLVLAYLPAFKELEEQIKEQLFVYKFMYHHNIAYRPTYTGMQNEVLYKEQIKLEQFKTKLLKTRMELFNNELSD